MQTVESNEVAGQVEETGVVTGMPKAKRENVKTDVLLATVVKVKAEGGKPEDVAKALNLKPATVEQRMSKIRTMVEKDANLTQEQKDAFREKYSFKRGSTGPRTSGAALFALSGLNVAPVTQGETEQNPAETVAQ